MAIDPMLYKKYSGRSGDPYERLGAALAQSAAQKSELKAAKDKTMGERLAVGHLKGMWVKSIVASVIALIVLAAVIWRGGI